MYLRSIACFNSDWMIINVRVVPNAKRPSITKEGSSSYKVRVNAPAVEGKANERLREILAEYFSVRKSDVSIENGSKGRDKTVIISE
ncbi:MAG: DUF167 domain-containing protein [Candidatus Marsarchaeota archaeon]|nr:DUF167 domain-containing protein [Candidatus Marsarchaeota archaeon]